VPLVALDEVGLPLLIDHRVLEVAVKKIEHIHLIALNGEPVAAEIKLSPA
jgi:hypothetical protein